MAAQESNEGIFGGIRKEMQRASLRARVPHPPGTVEARNHELQSLEVFADITLRHGPDRECGPGSDEHEHRNEHGHVPPQ